MVNLVRNFRSSVIFRLFKLLFKRFENHQLFLRVSALTLYSLLALVPILATLFGVAKGFGLAEMLEERIRVAFASQEQVMELLISFSKRSLEHVQGGLIAGIGVVIIVWTAARMIGHVEVAFNTIWGVKERRPFLRRISDYLFLLLILPLLLIFSGSLTVALTSGLHSALLTLSIPEDVINLTMFLARYLPIVLLALGFSFLYYFLPNTKVSLKAALLGGITTGILFHLSQWLYVEFQFTLSSYGAIYGSFAALPLFLIWLQIGWFLILFGGELTRALEERDLFAELAEEGVESDLTVQLTLSREQIISLSKQVKL